MEQEHVEPADSVRILVADDFPDGLRLVESVLGAHLPGCTVLTANCGQEALRLGLTGKPDIILLDAMMPDLDGFEVCRKLKADKEARFIPILMLSGAMISSEDRVQGLSSGADGYLCKPFETAELVAQVKALLRLKRYQDQLRGHQALLSNELETRTTRLHESEEKYRSLTDDVLDASSVGTFILNADLEVVWVNQAVEAFFGLKREDLIGEDHRNVIQLVLPKLISDDEIVGALLTAYDQGLPTGRLEVHVLPGEQRPERWLQLRSEPILSGLYTGGRMEHYIDITDIKHLEQQLLQAQKMESIGRLAGGIAHDFNNLLTSILGFSRLLMDDFDDDDPRCNDVREIIQAGERASKLTRQLLAFGRRQLMKVVPVDVNGTVEAMAQILRRTLGEDVALMALLEPELPHIEADEGQLEQVLMNLAVNARDAMANGGTLTIRTAIEKLDEEACKTLADLTPGPHVLLSFRDTGTGMPKEVREHAFEPFFTTKEVGKGTGLGLSTVYGIVHQFGGDIDILSEDGEGTEIRIYLPPSSASAQDTAAIEQETLPVGTETILLVEDEDTVRHLTSRFLRKQGYNVLSARSGPEALTLCSNTREPIHMVVSDVVMPNVSGPAMVEELRRLRPEIAVLFITGFAQETMMQQGVADGAEILMKPYDRTVFVRTVRNILDGSATTP